MKKIIPYLFGLIIFSFVSLIIILSTTGIETNRFNKLASKKISETNKDINLKLNTIKFKLDVREISLFLYTVKPKIIYKDVVIPAKNIKVYINFLSLIKSNPRITKINLVLEELDFKKIKKISKIIKPSNFKSLINNKIKKGKLISDFEIYFNKKNLLENFIVRGSVSNLKIEINNNFNLEKTKFSFFADKTDILIKNVFGVSGPIKIIDGDLKLKLLPEILLESNFKTKLNYIDSQPNNHSKLIKDIKYIKDIVALEADIHNSFQISFDKTYKVKKYDYKNSGKILKAKFDFEKKISNIFSEEKIDQLTLINSKISTNFNSQKKNTVISGKYFLNNSDLLSFNFENKADQEILELKLDAEYNKEIDLKLINYKKPKGSIANLTINLEKQKNNININNLNLTEKDNSILIEDLKLKNNKFSSFKKISVKTENNNFSILYGKKIIIKGSQFDASNLPKIFKRKSKKNNFIHINKDVEIDILNIIAPLSENLKNFKLIGKIKKGKFIKISSKGDFGNNNFLDISMKSDKKSGKKYLEIYSDLTQPLLTEYNFFKGLVGGNLLYSSIIDGDSSNSKLKIENFKVIDAPGMVKLLSLADLGGLADLVEGEGITFNSLEINIDEGKDLLKFNEILALGPSVSVLMEGYQDQSITSLKGTLIPAKTLNKIFSSIPLLGDIVIPKEAGEGLFGISFKVKGPPGKMKTTINPIRTITPRFIQKIFDKSKKSK